MALTANVYNYTVMGNKAVVVADVALDSAYPFGGYSLNHETLFGLQSPDFVLFEGKGGYSFQYDYTNRKMKVFTQAPPIVVDEKKTMNASYQVTTDYPAAFFQNVTGPADNLAMRSTGIAFANLSDGQCCLAAQMAEGARTTLTCRPTTKVSNGTFTGAATGWTLGAGWAYGTNAVDKSSDGTGTLTEDVFAAVVGRVYEVQYTISGWSVGTVTPTCGGADGTAVGADGTYTERFTATTTGGIIFTPTNTSRFTIDNVIVRDCTVYATYITQAWKEVWDNVVQDEAVTLASGATANMANTVAAVMYADQTTATARALTLIDQDDTAASGEIAFYFGVSTAQIKATHADQDGKSAKITYLKKPSSGFLNARAFANETGTNSGTDPYRNTFDYPILIWGYTGQMPVNGGVTQKLVEYSATPAAGLAVLDWFNVGQRFAADATTAPATGSVVGVKSNVTGTAAGVWGTWGEVQAIHLECKDGQDLSDLSSLKAFIVGSH